MRRIYTSFALFLGIAIASAQPDSLAPVSTALDTNNINFTSMANGDMGWDYIERTTLAPKTGDAGFLFASSLWLGAPDNTGNLHLAANTYKQNGLDYWPGPIGDDYDTDYDDTYNRSWLVSSDQIMFHREQFNLAGYVMPEVIENWPGNGNTTNGESAQLAPYYDINSNEIYEPHFGDFPLIRGNKAIFIMYNDDREIHASSGGAKIGAEVHMMIYAYDSVEPELDNSVFVHYEVFNRGSVDFLEFYAGVFNDWELGGYADDYIACDIDRNLSMVFNTDNFDEDIYSVDSLDIINGYGINPPAAGMVSLNEDIYVHWSWNNNFNPKTGNPEEAEHYFNYLNAMWKDGSINSWGNNPNYMMSIELEDTTDLDFVTNIPDDRRSLHGVFLPSFLPGESFCLDFAYVYARNTTYTAKQNAVLLMDYVDDIQVFYDDHFANCTDHTADFDNLSTTEFSKDLGIELLKGTGLGELILSDNSTLPKHYSIQVINILGQPIFSVEWDSETELLMNLSKYSQGMYYIQIKNKGKSIKTLPITNE